MVEIYDLENYDVKAKDVVKHPMLEMLDVQVLEVSMVLAN